MNMNRLRRSSLVAITCAWMCGAPLARAGVELPQTENTFSIGDAIELTVVGYESEVKGVYRVTPSGTLEIPYVGSLRAQGMTLAELLRDLEAKVHENYLHRPQVLVRPIYSVSVLGQVNRPGAFEVAGGEHLSRLIAMAGGSATNGMIQRSTVSRGGTSKQTDLKKAIEEGRTVDDVGIRSGDVIFVPKSPWYREFNNWAVLVSSVSLAFAIYDRVDRN
jgi:polysaccharide export outer membrane protein